MKKKLETIDTEIKKTLKFAFTIMALMLITIAAIDEGGDHGIFGRFVFQVSNWLFGSIRILVPLYGVTLVIIRRFVKQKMNTVVFVLASVGVDACLIASTMDADGQGGGVIGNILFRTLTLLFNESAAAALAVLYALVIVGVLVYTWYTYKGEPQHKTRSLSTLIVNAAEYAYEYEDTVEQPRSTKGQWAHFERVFEEHGLDVQVTGKIEGATVDRYPVALGRGVKANRVVGMAKDLQIALQAENLSITAEHGQLYIDIPRAIVRKIELKGLNPDQRDKLDVPIGVTPANKIIYGNLREMIHIIVAGTTGSGKSTFIHSMIISLLQRNNSNNLKFLMIDPKIMELSVYNGIPHLIGQVVTDTDRVKGALDWLIGEMTKRNKIIAGAGYRNIDDYNRSTANPLPRIICVIDELSRVMNSDTAAALADLAALSRASGIHLVFAMQRPDADTLPGKIKANMPTSITFKVKNGSNSRIALDSNGAEKLRGNGDMLFQMDDGESLRLQGFYVSNKAMRIFVSKIKEYARCSVGVNVAVEPAILDDGVMDRGHDGVAVEVLDFNVFKKRQENKRLFVDDKTEEVIERAIVEKKISMSWIYRTFGFNHAKCEKIFNEILSLESRFNIKIIGARIGKGEKVPFEFLLTESQYAELKERVEAAS